MARGMIRWMIVLLLVGTWLPSARATQPLVTGGSIEPLWAQASQAQQAQQYSRAALLYQQILAIQPSLTEAEINLGLVLHLAGDRQSAIRTFKHVLTYHPNLFVPNFLVGIDLLSLGNPTQALPYIERAANQKPDQIEVRLGLANSYLQLGKFPEAVKQFTRATELNRKSAEAWYGLGATYLSLEKQSEGDLRHTTSSFRTVLLGESYLQQGQAEKAVATLSIAVTAQPPVPCARSILGFAYLRADKPNDAAHQFQADWDARSETGCLLAKLGSAALNANSGRTADALRELREAAATDPAFVEANSDWYLGNMVSAGVEPQARDILKTARANSRSVITSDSPEEMMRRARYSACSDSLAIAHFVQTLKLLRLESLCSFYVGRDDRVLSTSETILRQNPKDPEALYWRIQSMERAGLEALTRGTELNPESASLHTLLGDMLRAKGDLGGAADEYAKALSVKPEFVSARLGLARTLYSDHKAADAEAEVKKVLMASPDDAEANYLMGEILVNRMDLPDALPLLLKALHVGPEELPYVHADLSTVYEYRGDLEKAISEMRQAVSVDVDGSYYYRLGHLYLKLGNRAAATEALNEAARLRHAADTSAQFQK